MPRWPSVSTGLRRRQRFYLVGQIHKWIKNTNTVLTFVHSWWKETPELTGTRQSMHPAMKNQRTPIRHKLCEWVCRDWRINECSRLRVQLWFIYFTFCKKTHFPKCQTMPLHKLQGCDIYLQQTLRLCRRARWYPSVPEVWYSIYNRNHARCSTRTYASTWWTRTLFNTQLQLEMRKRQEQLLCQMWRFYKLSCFHLWRKTKLLRWHWHVVWIFTEHVTVPIHVLQEKIIMFLKKLNKDWKGSVL